MNIREVEDLTGLVRANIRYYEDEGFFTPQRERNGYRNYSDEDIEVLKRIKLLRMLEEEIPHGTAVTIEEWKEEGRLVSIRAEIYCEKASHKGIIIGKGGSLIKKIGSYARQDIEKMLDSKVFLDLYVRVKENWRDSNFNISDFGFKEEE